MEADPEMAASIETAVETLAGLGAEIREIDPGPLQDYATCNRIILQCEAYAIHEKWLTERPQDYGERARERLLAGAFYRAVDYRSEEHTSELQSLMRNSYAVFCLKKKKQN